MDRSGRPAKSLSGRISRRNLLGFGLLATFGVTAVSACAGRSSTQGQQGRFELDPNSGDINALAFTPGGRYLISGDAWNNVVSWDLQSRESSTKYSGALGAVTSVAVAENGKFLAAADGSVSLWDLTGGRLETGFPASGAAGAVSCVAFGPNSEVLAGGGADGVVRLWRVADGQLASALKGHEGNVASVAFSPDGQLVASGGFDGSMRLWGTVDSSRNSIVHVFPAGSYTVNSVAFTLDGASVVIGDESGDVSGYQIGRGKLSRLWKAADVVYAVAVSDSYIAAGIYDGSIELRAASIA